MVDVWREKSKISSNTYLDNGILGVVKIIKKLLETEIPFSEQGGINATIARLVSQRLEMRTALFDRTSHSTWIWAIRDNKEP